MLKIYLLKQTIDDLHVESHTFVVVAANEEEAQKMVFELTKHRHQIYLTKVLELGTANPNLKTSIVTASLFCN